MFRDRQWNFDGVKTLIKKINMTGSIEEHKRMTPANINEVEGLTLSQEDKPPTQFTMENCATACHIFKFSRHNHNDLQLMSNISSKVYLPQ